MSNDCRFFLRVVAKFKKSINALHKIMKSEDPDGRWMYKVKDVQVMSPVVKTGDFYTAVFTGDVGWSDKYWFHSYFEEFGNDGVSQETIDKYVTLPVLCSLMNMGVECWTEEPALRFRGHVICNTYGKITVEEERKYEDEDPISGFGEDFGDYSPNDVVFYGSKKAARNKKV